MPTKTAVKDKVNGTAVEEAEEGTTPTPAPTATKKRPAEEEPAKSSEADDSAAVEPEQAPEDGAPKTKAKKAEPKPPSLVDIQRTLYKDAEVELWVSPEYEVEGEKTSRKIEFVFPRMTTVVPNRQFLRRIYNLEPLFQYFEWMNLAKIPPFIQDLTDGLSDDQFNDLFNGWFTDAETDDPK